MVLCDGLKLQRQMPKQWPARMRTAIHAEVQNEQSPTGPFPPFKPKLADMGWIAAGSIRAVFELARARHILSSSTPKTIAARNAQCAHLTGQDGIKQQHIAFIIPRLAKRLPWRADCLVQAIAAQNWLSTLGISSAVEVGVQNSAETGFGSHAWLVGKECGSETVILGDDGQEYTAIIPAAKGTSPSS